MNRFSRISGFIMTPNFMTLSRIGAIPVIVVLLMSESRLTTFIAALLFCIAAITDYFDGYLARTRGLVTNLGKIIDPLADKLLVVSTLVMLAWLHFIPGWIVCIIIGREISVTGLRCVLIENGQDVAASWLGKYKTGLQIAALIPLLIHYNYFGIHFNAIGQFFLYAALIFTIWSGTDYFIKARKFLSF
jgi:CDP-diacylglycerol--glycerol-3-phosphate 3-phosphatidyltransferase